MYSCLLWPISSQNFISKIILFFLLSSLADPTIWSLCQKSQKKKKKVICKKISWGDSAPHLFSNWTLISNYNFKHFFSNYTPNQFFPLNVNLPPFQHLFSVRTHLSSLQPSFFIPIFNTNTPELYFELAWKNHPNLPVKHHFGEYPNHIAVAVARRSQIRRSPPLQCLKKKNIKKDVRSNVWRKKIQKRRAYLIIEENEGEMKTNRLGLGLRFFL